MPQFETLAYTGPATGVGKAQEVERVAVASTLTLAWGRTAEPSYRIIAGAVACIAAACLFALGLILQLMTYELFEAYSEFELPTISKPLFQNFGYGAVDRQRTD